MDFTRILPLLVLLMVAPPGEGHTRASGGHGLAPSGIERGEHVESASQDYPASRRGLPTRKALGKGVFLVASETLSDPNFSQTVVLLLEYDETGAVGLIINRPTQVSLASLLPAEEELKDRPELVFIGGPVDKSQLFLLLRSASALPQSEEIVDGVYASTSLGALREILAEESTVAAFQAYAGYSGWGPGQLDAELVRGDWLIAPADSGTVFDKAAGSIWPELIRKNRGLWVNRTAGDRLQFAIVSRP